MTQNISSVKSDSDLEREIVARGLTAPRVTADDIQANIASEHYFTAGEGLQAAITLTGTTPGWPCDDVSKLIPEQLDLLTFCVLRLKNGFTVTGESACASPENFNAEVGRMAARSVAINKVWPLMGYALREQLHKAQTQ